MGWEKRRQEKKSLKNAGKATEGANSGKREGRAGGASKNKDVRGGPVATDLTSSVGSYSA